MRLFCSPQWDSAPAPDEDLEGDTQEEMQISKEALFKVVSTPIGPRTIGKVHRQSAFSSCVSPSKSSFGSREASITHLRNAAEYGVSTNIWANFYTNSMNLK